jgi:hypothetical protein
MHPLSWRHFGRSPSCKMVDNTRNEGGGSLCQLIPHNCPPETIRPHTNIVANRLAHGLKTSIYRFHSMCQSPFKNILLENLPVFIYSYLGCPRNEKKNFSVRTETNRNKICFAFVSVCFVKPKIFFFGLFRCFEPISKQPKQTELFRNEPKQPGIF